MLSSYYIFNPTGYFSSHINLQALDCNPNLKLPKSDLVWLREWQKV